jgi:hypothetical protein
MPLKTERTSIKVPEHIDESELRCPKCHRPFQPSPIPKELILYSEWLLPHGGDLESCSECGTVLEYASDATTRLFLKVSPLDELFLAGMQHPLPGP